MFTDTNLSSLYYGNLFIHIEIIFFINIKKKRSERNSIENNMQITYRYNQNQYLQFQNFFSLQVYSFDFFLK